MARQRKPHRTITVAAAGFTVPAQIKHMARNCGDKIVFVTYTRDETDTVLDWFPSNLPYAIR